MREMPLFQAFIGILFNTLSKAMRQYKKAAVLEEENPEYLLAAGMMARTVVPRIRAGTALA